MAIAATASFIVLLASMFAGPAPAVAADDAPSAIYVIVHKDNKADADDMTTTIIKEIFLKMRASFPGGDNAEPVNQKEDHGARSLFFSKVLKMSDREHAKHWDNEKVRSGKTRPKECSGDGKVFSKVSSTTDAIGYVSKAYLDDLDKDERAKVKIVQTVNK